MALEARWGGACSAFGDVRRVVGSVVPKSRRAQWAALAFGFVFLSCSADPGAGNDSTTHFWETCGADAECGSHEQCICGRCTKACEADDNCIGADLQCVGSLPALECDPPHKVCAPTSALKVPEDQELDASLVDASPSASVTPETKADAGISTTGAVASETTAEISDVSTPVREASSQDASAAAVPMTASTDEVSSFFDQSSTREPTSSPELSSEVSVGETDALAPLPTPEEKYATWGTPWWMWDGAKPEPVTGCELTRSSVDESECTARWECAEHTYDVACSKGTGDGWGCGCSYPGMPGTQGYFFSSVYTADPTTACQVGLAACTTIETERECVNQPPEYIDDYYSCEWERLCTIVTESPDIVASDSGRGGHCIDDDGFSLCWCDGPNVSRTYVVHDAIGEAACDALHGVCDADLQPQTWQQPDCVDDVQRPGETCQIQRTCPLLGELPGDITALSQLRALSQCSVNQDGELECFCNTDFGELKWLETRPAGTERCLDALDMCQHSEDIVFDSEPVCGGAHGETKVDDCWRSIPCTTTGTYQGVELKFTTGMQLGCSQPARGGPWDCYCNAGKHSSFAEFDGPTELDVCAQYEPTCLPQVEFGLPVVDVP